MELGARSGNFALYFSEKCFFIKRVIQLTALEDSNVWSKEQWDDANKFMEDTVTLESEKTEQRFSAIGGPGGQERWLHWTSRTKEQVFDM